MTGQSLTHRVLLVDDEPALLGALRRVVERSHPKALVVYAADPATAVWQIETTALRLVVTDMRMQGDRDAGWAVINAARAAGIPVCVLTGADEEDLLQALAQSAVPLVQKQRMSTEKLAAIVEQALAA